MYQTVLGIDLWVLTTALYLLSFLAALFAFSHYSLERLSQMFELPLKEVHSVVSKMIIKEELLVSRVLIECSMCTFYVHMYIRMLMVLFTHVPCVRPLWMNQPVQLYCTMLSPTNCSARLSCSQKKWVARETRNLTKAFTLVVLLYWNTDQYIGWPQWRVDETQACWAME